MCDDSNTQYLYTSNGEEELDTDNIVPPKMPDYRPHEGDKEMLKSDNKNTRTRNHGEQTSKDWTLYTTVRGKPNKSDLSKIFAIHSETKHYAGWNIWKRTKGH